MSWRLGRDEDKEKRGKSDPMDVESQSHDEMEVDHSPDDTSVNDTMEVDHSPIAIATPPIMDIPRTRVNGRPATVYVIQAHSAFTDLSSESMEVQRLNTPFAGTGINYINLVDAGSKCIVLGNPAAMYMRNIGNYLSEGLELDIRPYIDEISQNVATKSDPKTGAITALYSRHPFMSEATIRPDNPPALLQFWNHGKAAQIQGVWNLSALVESGISTPMTRSEFLGIPLPNVNDKFGSLKDNGREFATELIPMIRWAFTHGPGLSRFSPELLESTIRPIAIHIITSLQNAKLDYRATFSLSFVSYLLAAMTPPDKDIYIIIGGCRNIPGIEFSQTFGRAREATVGAVQEQTLGELGSLGLGKDPMKGGKTRKVSKGRTKTKGRGKSKGKRKRHAKGRGKSKGHSKGRTKGKDKKKTKRRK